MEIISVLTYFGFTPSNVTTLFIIGGIGYFTLRQHFDLKIDTNMQLIRKDVEELINKLQEFKERFIIVESRVEYLWRERISLAGKS